ncbi:MAG: diguanylate cyclase [Anaerolineaceae bacterium]|nr:diguanylate cyclase [Anaerolineaceae bacterium]
MELFLTPASISYIAQTIVFLAITVYLILKNNGTKANFWLGVAFSILVAAGLAGFVGVSSLRFQTEGMLLHDTLLVLGFALITQFAYNFSTIKSVGEKQAKLILWVNNLLTIVAIASTVVYLYRFISLPFLSYIPIMIEVFLVLEITWLMIFFIFMTVKLSTLEINKSWFYRFLHPQGRLAIAAHGFSFSFIALWIFWLMSIFLSIYGYTNVSFFIFTMVTTWALTFFVIALIDQTIRRASFFFKFIIIILLTTFTGISSASWLTAPASTANYFTMFSIPNLHTIHFEQNNAVYEINYSEFIFFEDIGREITFPEGETTVSEKLGFTFPFSGENWESVLVNKKGFIAFNENVVNLDQLSLPGNPNPIIATLYVKDLIPSENSTVFINNQDDKTIITWFLASDDPDIDISINTQLILTPVGSFDISYNDVRVNIMNDPYIPTEMQQVSGFFLGSNDKFPSRIKFDNQLPLTSIDWKGVYQDYYIDFRNHLHWSISMQFIAMLLVSLLMLILYPILIETSLVKPIQTIRTGISHVVRGDLTGNLEPRFSDDLGQTTFEFNQMVRILNEKQHNYENQIQDLDEKLNLRNMELHQTLEKLANEINNRKKMKAYLDKCIQQNKTLEITDELGCNNRAQTLNILEDEIKRSKRYNTSLSFVIVDPDYLRMINETYGFSTGDEVLSTLVQLLMHNIRETDIIGRIGGEEFAIIMPQTIGKDAVIGANRIRNLIGSKPVETNKGPIRLSASMGVVEVAREGIASIDLLLHQANLALDVAKKKGRNQAVLYNSSMEKEIS